MANPIVGGEYMFHSRRNPLYRVEGYGEEHVHVSWPDGAGGRKHNKSYSRYDFDRLCTLIVPPQMENV